MSIRSGIHGGSALARFAPFADNTAEYPVILQSERSAVEQPR
jgi:hypothetical protein